ncbi:GNAT family N-acetyltransferase [Methanocalculus taiwanensis]|uniref:GNAT family N-acetyltransferase n=1 Tax=Methanocalculus taiwanensis TaxID=106207 RepID=A0ABD4TIP7_9EURY|nr:GNAT family N-acetyltransferase [Methanocalculus taiwanensis]MCQ1537818.1 GNAT family N-acetyltransferase [Methanocalculus taiwanensis]
MEQGLHDSLTNETFEADTPHPRKIYSLLTSSDIDEVTQLYMDVFLDDEPTSRAIAPDRIAAYQDALGYVLALAENGLSFIARDGESGGIAGFIFCFDLLDDPTSDGAPMAALSRHFPEAISMIDELEDMFLKRSGVEKGSVLHIYQIGVGRPYRGRGIATALIRQVLRHAGELGYRQVVTDCTSARSRRAFERCGFSGIGYLAYDAFSYNGVCFFQGLEGGISLMAKYVDPYPLDPSSED